VLRLGFRVGADVEQQAVPGQVRQDRGEGRAVHSLDRSDEQLGGDHRRARVPGGNQSGRASVAHAVGRDPDRGVALLAEGGDGMLVHRHDLRGVQDLDVSAAVPRVLQEPRQLRRPSHQQGRDAELPRRGDGAVHVDLRGVIAPHGIHRDAHAHASNRKDFTSA
jgi:hypothetical protein